MFLYDQESSATRRARIRDMAERVLHRLGDSAQAIWTREEVESYVRLGAKELADRCRMVWDQVYLENLPAGFSYTSAFESRYVLFDYGLGGYTFEAEGELADEHGLIEMDDLRLAFFTNPSEIHYLVEIGAAETMSAIVYLPPTLTDIDRVTQDLSKIEATNHRRVARHDSRYQITEGEVFAYSWQKEGVGALRKIRVPNEVAETYEFEGSWGIVRDIEDVSAEDVEGSWGIPRRIPSWHPLGWSEGWGTPRRFYDYDDNFKVEFWRQPHIESMRDSELPFQYFRYLADYAQWRALTRNGPGQDFKLAQLYSNKWARNIERVLRRIERQFSEKTHRLGGFGDEAGAFSSPPRPRLPWQYGQRLR